MEKATLKILVRGDNFKIHVRQEQPIRFSNGFSYEGYYNETFSYFLKHDFEVWRSNCDSITVCFLDFQCRETLAIYPLWEGGNNE